MSVELITRYRWLIILVGLLLGSASSLITGDSVYFPLALLGVAGLLLAIFRLEWGLLMLAALLPLIPAKALMFLCALFIFAYLYRLLTGKAEFKIDTIGVWLLVFALALCCAGLLSFSPADSLQSLIAYGLYIALFFILSNVVKDRRLAYLIILALVLGAGLESAIGIYQYNVGGVAVQASWVDIEEYPESSTRVFGTMDNPNVLALYLELFMPMAFAWLYTARGLVRKSMFLVLTALMVLCMIYTASRTGWVAMAGSIFLFGLLFDRRIIAGALLGLAALMAYSPSIIIYRIQNLGGTGDSTFMYRTFIWTLCLNMVKDFWYAGVGLGSATFEKIYALYYMREGIIAHHSHNLYLQLLLETGVFGLASFLMLMYRTFTEGLNLLKNTLKRADAAMSAAIIAGFSAFLVHSLLEHSLYNYRIVLAFFVMLALQSILVRINNAENPGMAAELNSMSEERGQPEYS